MTELNSIIDNIEKLRANYHARRNDIKADTSLSESGKKAEIAKVFTRSRTQYEQLRKDLEAKREQTGSALRARAFSTTATAPADALAYDDAVHRFRQATPAERRARLQDASHVTAAAIAKASYEINDTGTLDEYATKYGKVAELQPLVDFDSAYNPARMTPARKVQLNFALTFPSAPE